MARMPGARWVGPTVNEVVGGMSTVVGVCLHVQQGNQAGSEAWQRDPASQVSSHFLISKAGQVAQMVDTADRAWCEVSGNPHFLSVELEGWTGQAATAAQLAACARILLWSNRTHGVRLAVCDDPNADQASGGLAYHSLGGAAWGDHPDCPGAPIIAQRPAIVAAARILGGYVTDPLTPTERDQLGAVAWAVTEIPDPDNPQGPRIPAHIALYRLLQQQKIILDRLDRLAPPSSPAPAAPPA